MTASVASQHHSQRGQQQQRQHEHQQQQRQHEQQQQQQQQQHHHRRRQQHVQRHRLRRLQLLQLVAVVSLCAAICVNGQIDGYTAGVDYPAYETVPKGLSFNCQGRMAGYYADTETRCQVWHWCLHSGHQYSFLCPNGTVFNQAVRVCDWWSNVNCPASEQLYRNNEELYQSVEQKREREDA